VPLAASGRRIEDVCELDLRGKPLGKGSFGAVWRARLKSQGGGTVAVKALDKRQMEAMKISPRQVQSEVELMRECKGQRQFVQLYDFIESSSTYFIVLEYCDGGSLERTAKDGRKLGDNQVIRLMRQMLEGLAFLHSKSICHRDVKPHNAMLVGKLSSEHVSVKLGDFGIAVRLPHGRLLRDKTGSPAFMAPEMHLLPDKSAGYDHKVDMWAIGAVMVFLLAHEYAFVDESGRLMRDELLRGDLPIWEADAFSSLFQHMQNAAGLGARRPSAVARDLVRQLLAPNPQQRLTAQAALDHGWLRQPAPRAEPRCGDDVPLLLWEDFRGLIDIEGKLPGMAAWVVDTVGSTCGLEALVQNAARPLRAASRERPRALLHGEPRAALPAPSRARAMCQALR